MKKQIEKKKVSKKVWTFALVGILALALVAATVYYMATINVTANISEPFVTSTIPLSFSGYATDVLTQDISITNNAQASLPATITWLPKDSIASYTMKIIALDTTTLDLTLLGGSQIVNIPNGEHTITVAFSTLGVNSGTLHLTQKDLNTWAPLEGGITADIKYTITGAKFVVEGIPTGYDLIYYPEVGGFTENVANIIVLNEGANDIASLPMSIDIGDDYCNIENSLGDKSNPNAKICNGAKLWLVPTTALSGLQDGSWDDASSFLFETDLITYTKVTSNSIGVITVERRTD